jgi:hypothetical protein
VVLSIAAMALARAAVGRAARESRHPRCKQTNGEIASARLERLQQQPRTGAHRMTRVLAPVRSGGIETADMLANEAFSRPRRDQRAVARYGGLTGSPEESDSRRREKGPGLSLARAGAGHARVRRSVFQLARRFLIFQKDSALARWYRQRTAATRGGARKTMIVALARKLLIGRWRLEPIAIMVQAQPRRTETKCVGRHAARRAPLGSSKGRYFIHRRRQQMQRLDKHRPGFRLAKAADIDKRAAPSSTARLATRSRIRGSTPLV